MAQRERDGIQAFLQKWQSENPSGRLFRANSGMAWAGRVVNQSRQDSWLTVTLAGARPFHGMPEGTPDLIGWTVREITPDMVGKRVAIFTGYEFKTPCTRTTIKQGAYLDLLEKSGGIAEIIRV